MSSSAVQLRSDWHDDYSFGDLDPTLWHLLCHFLVFLFLSDMPNMAFHFHMLGQYSKYPVTCLGITLESPEVTASTLQQTNSSLKLPSRKRGACAG